MMSVSFILWGPPCAGKAFQDNGFSAVALISGGSAGGMRPYGLVAGCGPASLEAQGELAWSVLYPGRGAQPGGAGGNRCLGRDPHGFFQYGTRPDWLFNRILIDIV